MPSLYTDLGAAGVADLHVRFYTILQATSSMQDLLYIDETGFANTFTVGLTLSGAATQWFIAPYGAAGNTVYTTPLNMNQPYCIEVERNYTLGTAKLWVNGKLIISITGIGANYTNPGRYIIFNPTQIISNVVATSGTYIGPKTNNGI